MKLDLSKDFDQNKAKAYFQKLLSKGSKIELTEFKPQRSLQQNKYFHVCIAFFCIHSGYTMEEGKVTLKRTFGSFMIYEKLGRKFLRSSYELNSNEMSIFIDGLET